MNSEKVEYLTWDTDFFKKKIGQIFVKKSNSLILALKEAKCENYQLVYVFCDENLVVENEILMQFNGKIVDRKVLFEKNIEKEKEQTNIVSEHIGRELTAELEEIAYISGEFSRFKLDENFQKEDFYRMYKIWMENSVKRKIANNVFVAKENEAIKGMATLKIMNKMGHIGLIAVVPDKQGKGYGKALIAACENELLKKNILKIEVATQLNNKRAFSFYEKCGFKIKEITNIYHFWL